jgi:transcriptional regulator with XRE-family HTH domain
MKPQFKNIANLIESKRLEAGLTQKQLAKLLGYNNAQTVSNIERGACSLPTKNLNQACTVLKISHQAMTEALVADYLVKIETNLKGELDL